MPLLRRVSVVLSVGILLFQMIRQVFFAPHTAEIATNVAAPRDDGQLEAPSSDILSSTEQKPLFRAKVLNTTLSPCQLLDDQREREELANKRSSQSTDRRPTDLTDRERLQLEQQQLRDEQAEQEAANYQESLQSTNRPQARNEPKRR